jgi:hypothetical protein
LASGAVKFSHCGCATPVVRSSTVVVVGVGLALAAAVARRPAVAAARRASGSRAARSLRRSSSNLTEVLFRIIQLKSATYATPASRRAARRERAAPVARALCSSSLGRSQAAAERRRASGA